MAALSDTLEDVLFGFFSESFEGGELALLTGLFKHVDGVDVELFVEEFDFFGAEAGNFKKVEEGGRKGGFEGVV